METWAPDVLAAARAAGRKIPDFFIVGHPKSGTTALYEMLRQHPDVFMPGLKETLFFARELHPGIMPDDPQPDSLQEYLDLFAPARLDQRAGEASPGYLRSRMAAARIAQVEPQARIIAILREPASFLRSMHMELLKDHVETEKDFRQAIVREHWMQEKKPVLSYVEERVEYVQQLRRYHDAFGRDQVLVLIYDDYRADPQGTVQRVLGFLDIDQTAPLSLSEANQTVTVRSPWAYEALRSLYLGRGLPAKVLGAGVKALTTQRVRHSGMDAVRKRLIYGKPPPPDEELMLALRRAYKPHVVALSEYLDRDMVALWGYDRID